MQSRPVRLLAVRAAPVQGPELDIGTRGALGARLGPAASCRSCQIQYVDAGTELHLNCDGFNSVVQKLSVRWMYISIRSPKTFWSSSSGSRIQSSIGYRTTDTLSYVEFTDSVIWCSHVLANYVLSHPSSSSHSQPLYTSLVFLTTEKKIPSTLALHISLSHGPFGDRDFRYDHTSLSK